MKIEIVLPSLAVGGMEMFNINLAREFRRQGHDAEITCIDALGALATHAVRGEVPHVLADVSGRIPLLYPRALIKRFRARRPDVVHSNTGTWNKVAVAASFTRTPFVHVMHGHHEQKRALAELLERVSVPVTRRVIAVSDALAQHAHNVLHVRATKLSVIRNGIDVAGRMGARATVRAALGLGEADVVVGAVGRLVSVKDHQLLVRSFARLRSNQADVRLVLVGGGPLDAPLRELADRLGVADAVLFLGERGDARDLLIAFDLYCLPSLSEGTSIGLLEAMAASLPVVATSVGGTPAVVGQDALLFEPGDEDGLVARLAHAVSSPEWRASTGSRLRLRAESSYSLEASASSYLRAYQSAMQP